MKEPRHRAALVLTGSVDQRVTVTVVPTDTR
jgi:hypothetical protein